MYTDPLGLAFARPFFCDPIGNSVSQKRALNSLKCGQDAPITVISNAIVCGIAIVSGIMFVVHSSCTRFFVFFSSHCSSFLIDVAIVCSSLAGEKSVRHILFWIHL